MVGEIWVYDIDGVVRIVLFDDWWLFVVCGGDCRWVYFEYCYCFDELLGL